MKISQFIKKQVLTSLLASILMCGTAFVFFSEKNTIMVASAEEVKQEVVYGTTETNIAEVTKEVDSQNLQVVDSSSIIEAVEAEIGMSVEESLDEQLNYYIDLSRSAAGDLEAINAMIEKTERLIEEYSSNDSVISMARQTNDETGGYTAVIVAAIAWFNASNYALSAELLTHAWENTSQALYVPINGKRVYSSPVTYEILNTTSLTGTKVYPIYTPLVLNNTSRNEEDLGFALHGVNYSRASTSSKQIVISDVYDFAPSDTGVAVLDSLVNIIDQAEELGLLVPYQVRITVDLSQSLRPRVLSMQNSAYTVQLFNYSNETIELFYNKQMCNGSDAINWTGLTNIGYKNIPANSSTQVSINTYGTATHIAFSYLKNGYRYITYADGVDVADEDINVEVNKVAYSLGTISLLGKNGSDWLVKVKNNSNQTYSVQYNAKMCNGSDAQNWTHLNDVRSFSLAAGGETNITISENGFSAYIALRITDDDYCTTYYANNLNSNCTMTLNQRTERAYKYLSITNQGYSNGWKIKIYNRLSSSITVYYNSKMCSESDARNWSGLRHIKSFTLSPGASVEKTIEEYLFATSVTFSYVRNGERIITYANGLNSNGAISVMYNHI